MGCCLLIETLVTKIRIIVVISVLTEAWGRQLATIYKSLDSLVKKHFSEVPSSHPVYLFSSFLIICLFSLSCVKERKIPRMVVCLRSKPYFCLLVSLFRNYLMILVCFPFAFILFFPFYFICAVEQNML